MHATQCNYISGIFMLSSAQILFYEANCEILIDTISQMTKIPSFYVLNRIAIGRPTILLALVVGTNQTDKCWARP